MLHAALILSCTFSVMPASPATESPTPAEKAGKAAAELPQGCILTAQQSGGTAPVIALAGKHEPAGVPPERIIFQIGSISKVFTGLLLAQAVLDKKVTLDTTLREAMGPKQTFADVRVAAITLRQLATHTSGLPRLPDDLSDGSNPLDPYASYSRTRLNACIARMKLSQAPPASYNYSNLGAGLLGDLLARVYGTDWESAVMDHITKPLGMTDTRVMLSSEQKRRLAPAYAGPLSVKPWTFQALAGAGALYSTATDMLRFGRALTNPAATPLKEVIEMAQLPQAGGRHGLLLGRELHGGATEYWSQGATGGYGAWISANPSTGEILVLLTNNGLVLPQDVLFSKAPAAPASPPDPTLTPYAGKFDTGVQANGQTIHYTFEVRGSSLWMQVTGQSFVELTRHPTKKDRFEFKPVQAEIQFTRKKDEVISTTLFQQGLEIPAKKLPTQP